MAIVSVSRAIDLLRCGQVVAVPTETVYGLAGSAHQSRAIASIYHIKGRPQNNPLIAHYKSFDCALGDAVWTPQALALAAAFWPGPLTLVLDRSPACRVHHSASAGRNSLALRMPDHPVFQEILQGVDGPVVAPSANPSGRLSPTAANHVLDHLDVPVVDGGSCLIGLESTIVDCRHRGGQGQAILLRPGAVSLDQITSCLGQLGAASHMTSDQEPDSRLFPPAPGLLDQHYAPRKPMRLNANHVGLDEGLLAFGPPLSGACITVQLSLDCDLVQAAQGLFQALHTLDQSSCQRIAVMPIPNHGIGLAIQDRLRRGAVPFQEDV
jgi:L-threonylcarbamoyladenylate synthase